jgi:hypothetical protein
LDSHLWANLKTTRPDTRPDCYDQVVRAASELFAHRLDGFRNDSKKRTPPTGVDCRNCPISGIRH